VSYLLILLNNFAFNIAFNTVYCEQFVSLNSGSYCFTNHVVNIWNSLPNWVVIAENTNIFKARLDTF